jgi:hypothetical protein
MYYKNEPRYRDFDGYEIVIVNAETYYFISIWGRNNKNSNDFYATQSGHRNDGYSKKTVLQQLKSKELKKYLDELNKYGEKAIPKVVHICMNFEFDPDD